MSFNFSRNSVLLIGAIRSAFLLSGCGVVSSLQFDDRLLVKLSSESNITQRKAMGFRHVAEGPNDPDAPVSEWPLAWNIKEVGDRLAATVINAYGTYIGALAHNTLTFTRDTHDQFIPVNIKMGRLIDHY
jgi:hypothetical protein